MLLAAFGFLLNFGWEMGQMTLFEGMSQKSLSTSTLICLKAAAVDVAILLLAFWILAWLRGGRRQATLADSNAIGLYTAVAFIISMIVEVIATRGLHRYSYGARMPIVPVLDVGLTPFLQWLLLPPMIFWLARRLMPSESRSGR